MASTERAGFSSQSVNWYEAESDFFLLQANLPWSRGMSCEVQVVFPVWRNKVVATDCLTLGTACGGESLILWGIPWGRQHVFLRQFLGLTIRSSHKVIWYPGLVLLLVVANSRDASIVRKDQHIATMAFLLRITSP